MTMYCEECQKNPANVHIVQIINGKKMERHLCEECAGKQNAAFFAPDFNFSIPNLLGSFFGNVYGLNKIPQVNTVKTCSNCGLRFTDIVNSGKLGCSECYRVFEEELEPSLRRLQGSSEHNGKIPVRNGEKTLIKKQIEKLKLKLQEAIAAEQYEKAAEIRDEIKLKEKQLS